MRVSSMPVAGVSHRRIYEMDIVKMSGRHLYARRREFEHQTNTLLPSSKACHALTLRTFPMSATVRLFIDDIAYAIFDKVVQYK